MGRILNVAEKNDAAKSLAEIMSRGGARRREGLSVYNKIYEFPYNFQNQEVTMVMTSVSGHLLGYEFNQAYKNWHSCSPAMLFDAPLQKACLENTKNIKATLEREIRGCNVLIIWTDCDREGENIGFQIIQTCLNVKRNIKVYRAKFSEITHGAVSRAMRSLGTPDENVSWAVDVRQELDLRIGAAFTRFQTLRLQRVFPEVLDRMLISYGSCQFPTLGFVVERYQQIRDFVAEPFWKIEVKCASDEGDVSFNWKRQRLFDYEACRVLYEECIENPEMTIVNKVTKAKSKWRPCALDTVEMEKLSSRKLKINAKEVMVIAEKLYNKGFISYPRTETNRFPKDFDLVSLVSNQVQDAHWGEFAQRQLDRGLTPRNGNKSDQAHPPIHPTKYTNTLQGNDKKVYEFIVRHFLACVSMDAQGEETSVEADVAGEKFGLSGLTILARNYLEVYPYDKWSDKTIPYFEVDQKIMPKSIEMTQSETSPPSLLTEADLIALMEKHGIGTDATHAEHIETIKSRTYVGLNDGKFVPGELGMGLVEGYNDMGYQLAKPHLRAELEADLKKICLGQKNKDVVLAEQISKYKEVFIQASENAHKLDQALVQYFGQANQAAVSSQSTNAASFSLCKCPSCNSHDLIIKRKRDNSSSYISCMGYPSCKYALWLPSMVLEAQVLQDTCSQCSINDQPLRKIKFTFKPNSIPMSTDNTITTCIGGCDLDINELLDVKLTRGRSNNNNNINSVNNNNGNNNSTNEVNVSSQRSADRSMGISSGIGSSLGESLHGVSSQRITQGQQSNSNSSILSYFSELSTDVTPQSQHNNRNNNADRYNNDFNSNRETYNNNRNEYNRDSYNRSNTYGTNNRVNNNDENQIVCMCGVDAKLLTVRKEGPNKGREFYVCPKPQDTKCSFFMWKPDSASGPQMPLSPRQASNMPNNDGEVVCNCGNPAVERTVNKEGPNKGRLFMVCSKPMGQGCSFFQWSDGVSASQPRQGTSAGNNSWNNKRNRRTEMNDNDGDNATRGRKKRKCGICGEEGHNRKNCPNNR